MERRCATIKPLPLFNILFHLKMHHNTEVSCNFRVHGDLNTDIFQGIEVRHFCIMTTNSCSLLIS